MDLPDQIIEQFREYGRAGGRERARRLPASRRKRIARAASIARWTRERFGAPHFADVAMPAGELVDKGLEDLAHEVESVEAHLVALAAPRLRREGVPVPEMEWPDPEARCYALLKESHGDMAYARYSALLERVEAFADGCPVARRRGKKRG